MKLVLYSGGYIEDNEEMDAQLRRLVGKDSPKVTFIPSCIEDAEELFEEFIEHFEKYGWDDFHLFPVDVPFTNYAAQKALSSDLVFLSGGNTFYFLYHLKRSGFAGMLKNYVEEEGVLAGESAGSIIMTPTIDTASYPEFDRDDNDIDLVNWKSMGLVRFDFFPHFENSRRYIHALNLESMEKLRPIYACEDGSGIIVEDNSISFIGRTWGFFRGKKFLLNS